MAKAHSSGSSHRRGREDLEKSRKAIGRGEEKQFGGTGLKLKGQGKEKGFLSVSVLGKVDVALITKLVGELWV